MSGEQMSFLGVDTLQDAKERLFSELGAGTTCPCCGQYARLYKRKLNRTMAKGLVWLVRASGPGGLAWVDYGAIGPRWLQKTGGTLATLEHWGLIEAKPNRTDPAKRCSGIWRPRAEGVRFVKGEVRVPAKVHLYNNAIMGWSKETVNIEEALGEPFDYQEMMNEDRTANSE